MFLCVYCVKCRSITFGSLGVTEKEDSSRLKRVLNKRRNSDSMLSCQKELTDITFSGERLEEFERRQRNAFVLNYVMNLPETFCEPSDSGISSESVLSQFSGEDGTGNYFSLFFLSNSLSYCVIPICYGNYFSS